MDLTLGGITLTDAVWVPLASALSGGALALLGSFGATWQNNSAARKTREEELEREGAERAYATFFKLFEAHNSAANLKREIDEMFDSAAKNGDGEMEPWAKVMELVGAADEIGAIEPSDTSFLITEKQANLLNEVHLIQRRIANIMASAAKYTEVRAEIHTFLVSNMSDAKLSEGTQVSAEFEGPTKWHVQMLEMRANNLLGQIMDYLEKDVPASWEVVGKFKTAASKRFGDKFPEFTIDTQLNC